MVPVSLGLVPLVVTSSCVLSFPPHHLLYTPVFHLLTSLLSSPVSSGSTSALYFSLVFSCSFLCLPFVARPLDLEFTIKACVLFFNLPTSLCLLFGSSPSEKTELQISQKHKGIFESTGKRIWCRGRDRRRRCSNNQPKICFLVYPGCIQVDFRTLMSDSSVTHNNFKSRATGELLEPSSRYQTLRPLDLI